MKTTRSIVVALFLALTAAACNSSPTAPTAAPSGAVNNFSPLLGSGIGG